MIQESIVVKKLTDPNQIFSNLQNGTNLPVTEALKKYIVSEIERMNAFSIVLEDNSQQDNSQQDNSQQVIGHCLLYEWESVLYFAFFQTKNDDVKIISELIDQIIAIAKDHKCTAIRGPINLPPIIYGYGFAEEDSDEDVFATAPFSSPVYIEIFEQRKFSVWHRVLHFRVPLMPISLQKKWDVGPVDFSHPETWKKEFIEIQMKVFPPSAQVTPNRAPAFNDYMEFIQEFGYQEMVAFARDNGKVIGTGWGTPDPFNLTAKGKCKNIVLFGGAILPEYQKQGVLKEMIFDFADKVAKTGIRWGEMPIADDNIGSITMAKSYGGRQTRSHVIMGIDL
jgi:hypothetical protein